MKEKVYAILREFMRDQSISISPDQSLMADLGLNSIDVISIIGRFEDEFDIEIPDQDLRIFQTVNDILAYLSRKKA